MLKKKAKSEAERRKDERRIQAEDNNMETEIKK
jgi:hypothetical protein